MKTRPILFTGAMIRAILDGTKTQTRRAVKGFPLQLLAPDGFTPEYVALPENDFCPYGKIGDRLAARETFWCWGRWEMTVRDNGKLRGRWIDLTDSTHPIIYDADGPNWLSKIERHLVGYHKRPSIYLPTSAWRVFVEITDLGVERLQDISVEDSISEGLENSDLKGAESYWKNYRPEAMARGRTFMDPRASYRSLWNSINGKPKPDKPDVQWSKNPWIWKISFKRIETPTA